MRQASTAGVCLCELAPALVRSCLWQISSRRFRRGLNQHQSFFLFVFAHLAVARCAYKYNEGFVAMNPSPRRMLFVDTNPCVLYDEQSFLYLVTYYGANIRVPLFAPRNVRITV